MSTETILDKTALELIQNTAVAANGARGKVEVLRPDAEPPGVYYLVGPDGKCDRKEAGVSPRDHRLLRLDQVAPFVVHVLESGVKPVVWYSALRVVVIVNDDDRKGQAVLEFHTTPQLATVENLPDKKFDQRTFIRLLRIDLKDCLSSPRLLAAARECNFRAISGEGGSVQHGKESLGREIEAEALTKAAEGFPEEEQLSIRIFDDPFLTETWPIRCAVEVHVHESRFELCPFPLEVHNAIDRELDVIGKYLSEDCKGVPVFRGTP